MANRQVRTTHVVQSETPRDPDLTLSDEALVRVGILDGPMECIFGMCTNGRQGVAVYRLVEGGAS